MTSKTLAPAPPEVPFHGIWPALLTPLDASLRIDHERFSAHALQLLAAGCAGITPFGTTGEGPSFTVGERITAINALVAAGVPAQRIIVPTMAAALPDVVALARHALVIGAHGCLMLPPFFFKGVSDAGIIDSYAQVIDTLADARLRVYLYNIPQVCGVQLTHPVVRALKARYPSTIVGIKDSQCERAYSMGLVDAFMPGVRIYVGNEPDLPTLAQAGSTGAISGLANLMPRSVHALVADAASDQTEARVQHIRDLLAVLGSYALIPALKGMMTLHSGDASWLRVRAPLRALDAEALASLRAQLAPLGIDPRQD